MTDAPIIKTEAATRAILSKKGSQLPEMFSDLRVHL